MKNKIKSRECVIEVFRIRDQITAVQRDRRETIVRSIESEDFH